MKLPPLGTISLILLAGCATAADNPQPPATIRSLAKGAFSGIREAKQAVIKDTEAWKKFWEQHTKTTRPPGALPEVNFQKEMAVVATMGTQRTGGFAIEIVGAETSGDKLRISIRRTTPPAGAMTIQALTAPFHFVSVPRSDLKPEFVDAGPKPAR